MTNPLQTTPPLQRNDARASPFCATARARRQRWRWLLRCRLFFPSSTFGGCGTRQQIGPLCLRATFGEFLQMCVKHSRLPRCACDGSLHLMTTGTLTGSSRGCVASPSEASLEAAHVFLHHGICAPAALLRYPLSDFCRSRVSSCALE